MAGVPVVADVPAVVAVAAATAATVAAMPVAPTVAGCTSRDGERVGTEGHLPFGVNQLATHGFRPVGRVASGKFAALATFLIPFSASGLSSAFYSMS